MGVAVTLVCAAPLVTAATVAGGFFHPEEVPPGYRVDYAAVDALAAAVDSADVTPAVHHDRTNP